ncbi:MAG: hypothetical protein A2902_00095 [Elusimicrobia bacterium RIFCSPLOWO2_01_FULL_64_13]|nr:MAG: hypothetical protein A2902_00095 [Elusimicrobia bacterium RIFCSPLOWO2_01_FULL_64_13]
MSKILFISDNMLDEGLGIMSLSSYLKTSGHGVDFTLLTDFNKIDDLFRYIDKSDPDLIGFSLMTPQVDAFRPITNLIKRNSSRKIIWGGPHCMFMAEDVAKKEAVDFICVGEGEEALLQLMDRLDDGGDYSGISNLWSKKGNTWITNPIGPLEEDLDKYPPPDRDLYYSKYPLLRDFAVKRFITQRGCPYDCAYCFEPSYKIMYKGKGKLMRRNSPARAVQEIRDVIAKYPTRLVHFSDDVFNLNKEWNREFLRLYKENIDLPWTCNVVVQGMDDELTRQYKEAGCRGVTFGLETGVEQTRMKLLRKLTPNRIYSEVVKSFRKHDILYMSNVMFMLPDETLDHALESMKFQIELQPFGSRPSMLKLYKGTELARYAVLNDLCEGVGEFTYKAKDEKQEHPVIENLEWAGQLFIKFPFLFKYAKKIMASRLLKFFNEPLTLYYTYWHNVVFFKIPPIQALRYFLASREAFTKGMGKQQVDNFKPIDSKEGQLPVTFQPSAENIKAAV